MAVMKSRNGMYVENFAGIDMANTLHSITTAGESYTATEDCWAVGYIGNSNVAAQAQVFLDGYIICASYSNPVEGGIAPICFPVKEGQQVTTRNSSGQIYQIGFKRLRF